MISYDLFEVGSCRHCERMTMTKGQFKQREYPSTCALIKHKTQGYILFDTGYSARFFHLTKYFPYSLYRHLTPVTLNQSLKQQLLAINIQPTDINYIVISHFHADHIGGLRDFPNAKFICHQDAIHDVKSKKGFRALLQGFLPGLLPKNFYERLIVLGKEEVTLEEELSPFTSGFDLFGDKQVFAIPLPGHAKGQIGLYFKAEKDTFLIADSCWHQEAYEKLIYPSNLTYLVHDNKEQYIQTIAHLHLLYKQNPDLDIIPTHCLHTRERIREKRP
ncbi:TPA: MBL fold metallo-hydrolase [Legionella feeleii]